MSQTPAGQNSQTYAADRPAEPQRADGITPGCALATTTACPEWCWECHPPRPICMVRGCPCITPKEHGWCIKPDCQDPPPPVVSPDACTGRPETCSVCNTTEALHMCLDCGEIVTDDTWPDHIPACPQRLPEDDPEPAARMPILNPYASQLMIELLDLMRTRPPYDAPHVTRADGTTDIPITNTGVLRLLRRPLDQRTTTALTTELTRYCNDYLKWAQRYPVDFAMSKEMYGPPYESEERYRDTRDQYSRETAQINLRHRLKRAVTR